MRMSTQQNSSGTTPAQQAAEGSTHAAGTFEDRECLSGLLRAIERSNRRWQIVVFPALFAFSILAIYGGYLVFQLESHVHRMTNSIEGNMDAVADRMTQVSMNLDELTGSVKNISVNLDELTGTVRSMGDTVEVISVQVQTMPPMLDSMEAINANLSSVERRMHDISSNVAHMNKQLYAMTNLMGSMSAATQHMTHNVAGMNQSFGRPLSFLNSFMPW
jgi:hypothetical protein